MLVAAPVLTGAGLVLLATMGSVAHWEAVVAQQAGVVREVQVAARQAIAGVAGVARVDLASMSKGREQHGALHVNMPVVGRCAIVPLAKVACTFAFHKGETSDLRLGSGGEARFATEAADATAGIGPPLTCGKAPTTPSQLCLATGLPAGLTG